MVSRRDGNRNLWSDRRCSPRRSWNSRMSGIYRRNVQQRVWAMCTILLHTMLLTWVWVYFKACADRTCIHDGIEQKWLFFSLLITYAIRKPRRLRAAHNVYTESKDVIWKIGSSNRIISFNSCLDKSLAAADTVRDRFLSSILIPNISVRVATIKRISNFRVGSTGKQASEFSCYSLCK